MIDIYFAVVFGKVLIDMSRGRLREWLRDFLILYKVISYVS